MIELTILMASLAGLFIASAVSVVASIVLLRTAIYKWRHRSARHDRVRLDHDERMAFAQIAAHYATTAGWSNGSDPDKALPTDCPQLGRAATVH